MSSSRGRPLGGRSAIRLTLRLLLVFAAVATLALAGAYWLVEREITQLTDVRLQARRDAVLDAMAAGQALPEPGFGQSVMVIDADGARGDLPFAPPEGPDGLRFDDLEGGRPEYRYLVHTASNGARSIVAESIERQDELLEILRGGLQLALSGALLAGAAAGLLFSRREQARLDLVGDGLAQVASGRLSTRISLPGPDDDLHLLASRINETAERLERAMERMRVQSANIAHDLRTPLARLRAGIESSLMDLVEHQRPVHADALGEALEQIDRIVGTFDALLKLSRLEGATARDSFATVDLGALASDLGAAFDAVAEAAEQRLVVEIAEPATIHGDRDLLVQLVANLIQNAMRYGGPGQRVTLSVCGCVLSVRDQGPGIPLAERRKVLQPLHRLDPARRNDGFGLGLSIVAAIVDLHGADLTLSDSPDGPGLQATVRFADLTKA